MSTDDWAWDVETVRWQEEHRKGERVERPLTSDERDAQDLENRRRFWVDLRPHDPINPR